MLLSHAETDDADSPAALGAGPLQGRSTFLADGRDEHFAFAARDDIAGRLDITKRLCRRSRLALEPSRTHRARSTRLAALASRAGRSCVAALTLGTGRSRSSRGAGSSGLAALAFEAGNAGRPLLSRLASWTGDARRAGRTRGSRRTGRAGRTLHAGRPLRTGCSCGALWALASGQDDRGGKCDDDAQSTHSDAPRHSTGWLDAETTVEEPHVSPRAAGSLPERQDARKSDLMEPGRQACRWINRLPDGGASSRSLHPRRTRARQPLRCARALLRCGVRRYAVATSSASLLRA